MRGKSILATVLGLLAAAASLTAQTATLHARVEMLEHKGSAKSASNAVVWLTPLDSPVTPPLQTLVPKLRQKNKSFIPALVVVPAGGKVEFPNEDPFFHNVFSLFEGKRFDLGLYESGSTRFVQFDRPGISYIFCNIHAQMSAVVVALATPYYGISNEKGEITVAGVPPGRYRMQVFHTAASPEEMQSLAREVTITEDTGSLGVLRFHASDTIAHHKDKYGNDYEPPSADYSKP